MAVFRFKTEYNTNALSSSYGGQVGILPSGFSSSLSSPWVDLSPAEDPHISDTQQILAALTSRPIGDPIPIQQAGAGISGAGVSTLRISSR